MHLVLFFREGAGIAVLGAGRAAPSWYLIAFVRDSDEGSTTRAERNLRGSGARSADGAPAIERTNCRFTSDGGEPFTTKDRCSLQPSQTEEDGFTGGVIQRIIIRNRIHLTISGNSEAL